MLLQLWVIGVLWNTLEALVWKVRVFSEKDRKRESGGSEKMRKDLEERGS